MNELQVLNIDGVECYEKDGTAYLKLETVARGLGFTQEKNGAEYVRWDRVEGYMEELGFPHKWGKNDFIPENVFYRLAMKAKNAAAEAFQAKIADEVIPSIRKHGAYMTPDTLGHMIASPEFGIRLLTALKEEQDKNRKLQTENNQQRQLIEQYEPKASYYDIVLQTPDVVSINKIAKDYGRSARWMNQFLHEKGVQYKQGNIWLLYQKYAGLGYTKSRTNTYADQRGQDHSCMGTYWTQKGRLFIYELLKREGIIPLIEMEKVS